MNHSVDTPLSVSIEDMPTVRVAYIECRMSVEQDQFRSEIRECFQRLQVWVRGLGYDPCALLTIGVSKLVGGQLSSYECCVQIPAQVKNGTDGVGIKNVVGGRYAVASIEKDQAIIGDSIRRFYQEYVPHSKVGVDSTRPTYEVYYENTMEYCVPIL